MQQRPCWEPNNCSLFKNPHPPFRTHESTHALCGERSWKGTILKTEKKNNTKLDFTQDDFQPRNWLLDLYNYWGVGCLYKCLLLELICNPHGKQKKLEFSIADEVIKWCCIFYIHISVLQFFSALQRYNRAILHYKGKTLYHLIAWMSISSYRAIFHPTLTFTKRDNFTQTYNRFDLFVPSTARRRTFRVRFRKNACLLEKK